MHTDYNITPHEVVGGEPEPRVQHATGAAVSPRQARSSPGPWVTMATALRRTATVGTPMPLEVWADDDALYSSGGNGPLTGDRPPVTVTVTQVPRPGHGHGADARRSSKDIKGGKPLEPYSGKAATTVTFSEPGEYVLHVNGDDYSGNGGGGSGCCWTTVMMKVTVTGTGTRTGGGQ